MHFLVYMYYACQIHIVFAFEEDELYKNRQGQITQMVGDRSLYVNEQ